MIYSSKTSSTAKKRVTHILGRAAGSLSAWCRCCRRGREPPPLPTPSMAARPRCWKKASISPTQWERNGLFRVRPWRSFLAFICYAGCWSRHFLYLMSCLPAWTQNNTSTPVPPPSFHLKLKLCSIPNLSGLTHVRTWLSSSTTIGSQTFSRFQCASLRKVTSCCISLQTTSRS